MSQKFSRVVRFAVAAAAVGMIIAAGTAYATTPTFSQTGVTVGLGQSLTITSTNGVSVYMTSNSGPTVVSVSANGTQITVTGQGLGSATIGLCAVGTASDCTNLAVTVQSGSVSGISFSQNNLSLSISGSQSVTVTGGNGTYTVSSNSNTSVASANLSGSTLTVTGIAAGVATISVCDTSNTCGTLSVTVNSASASGLSFGQNNISLSAGSSQTIPISGGNGVYSIFNISNPSAVSAGMTGNQIIIDATAVGSGTVKVCDTANVCGTLNVTVTASTASQAVMFSVTNPTLATGQTLNVVLSGAASSYFVLSNTNPNVAQASMSNSLTLLLSGQSAGTDSITVCATGGAGCASLPVTVTSSAGATTAATPATVATPTVQSTVTVVAPASTVQPATVVANTALLSEIRTLQSVVTQVLTQIESIQTQLAALEAQVNAGSGSGMGTNAGAAAGVASASAPYNFTELLTTGSQDAQVTALQQELTSLGFYSGPVTGYYGTLTQQAVTAYQTAHGIAATGYTGPSTRAALNTGK
jgi:hypothetical protein